MATISLLVACDAADCAEELRDFVGLALQRATSVVSCS